jgi:activator of HSP90 ATPase
MKKLTKVCYIRAELDAVFKALTDVQQIEEWSGDRAAMNPQPGGEFQLWDGSIQGINNVVSRTLIVQQWKDAAWPEYSKVTFQLSEKNGKTRLELLHEGIPDDDFESVKNGWMEFYLDPIKEMLEDEDDPGNEMEDEVEELLVE